MFADDQTLNLHHHDKPSFIIRSQHNNNTIFSNCILESEISTKQVPTYIYLWLNQGPHSEIIGIYAMEKYRYHWSYFFQSDLEVMIDMQLWFHHHITASFKSWWCSSLFVEVYHLLFPKFIISISDTHTIIDRLIG